MTAYIDDMMIVGTPKEIQTFIELRKEKVSQDIIIEGNVTFWGGKKYEL